VSVGVNVVGGNAYGGAVSLYIGGYSSAHDIGVAAVGDTVVRYVNVTLDAAEFASCSTRRMSNGNVYGASVYGGSFSFYIGAYAWSHSKTRFINSSSACGATNVSNVDVRIHNVISNDSSALQTSSGSESYGAHSYGGSMSVLYIGAYAFSRNIGSSSSSSSTCGATSATSVSVLVNNSDCFNCSALSSSSHSSRGANSYGGSMSVLHVGAHCMSSSPSASSNSSSSCGATSAREVSVNVSDSDCFNCSASVTSTIGGAGDEASYGVNAYGGSMSVLYVGAYSWSRSYSTSTNSHSTCGATNTSVVTVRISDSNFSHCSASTSGGLSYGANTYGGSLSAAYIGAFAYSFAFRGDLHYFSNSSVETTHVETLSITINNATINNSQAISGERCCDQCINLNVNKLTWIENLDSASKKDKRLTRESFGANVSHLDHGVFNLLCNIIAITNTVICTLFRCTAAPSA
jgi:hypothetical protein